MSTTAIGLFGIPNCDTVRKARAWLDTHGAGAAFHDFKKDGVPVSKLDDWLDIVGWERLLNRKGTSWRTLDESARAAVTDRASARAVMLAHPSTIKRPVVDWGADVAPRVTVGFAESEFAAMLAQRRRQP